eukprot:TRINITY_DN774_c0_g1_i11.p2 TRINITY_DN774_c0_g1~~TRINITY_DN774_c0_g1_i11.p2  ORF type:complete len:288 (-),score=68.13 TRINITY_DN774_c0_g1_i11:289-1044(-)
MATSFCSRTTFIGKIAALKSRTSVVPAIARHNVIVGAQQEVPRRVALGTVGAAFLLTQTDSSEAAYGDSANVFGKITNTSGFLPYTGEGFALLLPAKWNPSKEKDFEGVQLRYEDNFDAVNNLTVISKASGKKSIKDYGSPEDFLKEITYLFGQQSYAGQTRSEGGFKENRVSAASLLGIDSVNKSGKDYYVYELLVRSADGDEGGRHQLISATIGSDGQLYICKVQCGDKRWFKGVKKEATGAVDSFIVA